MFMEPQYQDFLPPDFFYMKEKQSFQKRNCIIMRFIIENGSPPLTAVLLTVQRELLSALRILWHLSPCFLYNMLTLLFLHFAILDIILQKDCQISSLTPFIIPNICIFFFLVFFLNYMLVFKLS